MDGLELVLLIAVAEPPFLSAAEREHLALVGQREDVLIPNGHALSAGGLHDGRR